MTGSVTIFHTHRKHTSIVTRDAKQRSLTRRRLLATTLTGCTLAVAGCTDQFRSNSDDADEEEDDRDYETPFVRFALDYDIETAHLTVRHDGGDPLTPENTGYIDFLGDHEPEDGWNTDYLDPSAGDRVTRAAVTTPIPENTVIYKTDSSVVEPGDTIRLEWVAPDDDDRTLTLAETRTPFPDVMVDIAYNPSDSTVDIRHVAGDLITPANTGVLKIGGDYDGGGGWDSEGFTTNPETPTEGIPMQAIRVGDRIYESEPLSLEAGSTITLEWSSPSGSYTTVLGDLTIP